MHGRRFRRGTRRRRWQRCARSGEGRAHAAVSVGAARERGGVVFVFPGQGSQWTAMGRALLAESSVFAETVAACEAALSRTRAGRSGGASRGRGCGGAAARAGRRGAAGAVCDEDRRWRRCGAVSGCEPAAVVGHSQGEIAAAVVAGALSLEDGARVVALRSQLVRRMRGSGGMAVIGAAGRGGGRAAEGAGMARGFDSGGQHAEARRWSRGGREAIERSWRQRLDRGRGVLPRVEVDYASHSAQVDRILAEWQGALSDVRRRRGRSRWSRR